MKQSIFIVLALFVIYLTTSSSMLEDNGIAGRTGAPGETTCNTTDCHTGVAVNSQGGSVTIDCPQLENDNWVYTPGQTYTVSVTVFEASRPLFGFCFEALLSSGANAGTLTPGTGTSIKTKNVQGNIRNSVVHNLNAGLTDNSHTFTFTWTAPATNQGTVTFYCAGNAANNNGTKSGDHIYTTSQVVNAPAVNVNETTAQLTHFNLYPNPVSETLNLEYTLTKWAKVEVHICDAAGRKVKNLLREWQWPGPVYRQLQIGQLSSGNYVLSVEADGQLMHTEQFVR